MFVQAAEETYRLDAISGRRALYTAAEHVVANKQTFDRPPEHMISRQEMTAAANFHQLREAIECR
jgi:hypothetical protein